MSEITLFEGDRESDDGWHVGYQVEMRGIGVEEYVDSEGMYKFSFLSGLPFLGSLEKSCNIILLFENEIDNFHRV